MSYKFKKKSRDKQKGEHNGLTLSAFKNTYFPEVGNDDFISQLKKLRFLENNGLPKPEIERFRILYTQQAKYDVSDNHFSPGGKQIFVGNGTILKCSLKQSKLGGYFTPKYKLIQLSPYRLYNGR